MSILLSVENPYAREDYTLPNKEAKEMAFDAGAKAQLEKVHQEILEIKNKIDAGGIVSPEAYGVFVARMGDFMQSLLKEVE